MTNLPYFKYDDMTAAKIRLEYLLIAGLFFTMAQSKSYAGGFPVRPGSLSISTSINYFFADKGWDAAGKLAPFAQNGNYRSESVYLYTEYGISRRFTFVATLPYLTSNYQSGNFQSKNTGVTDLETGIKYYLANIHYTYYFNVQATVITPLYTNNVNLGYGESGAEFKVSLSGSGSIFSKNYYFNIDEAVRQYFGALGPVQDRYAGTFGVTLDRKFKHQLSIGLGGFYSTSSFVNTTPINQALNKNFSFNQVSLSYGYVIARGYSVFLTAGKFITGRNTGQGSVASFAFILKPLKGF
jgi:hypothetical protein